MTSWELMRNVPVINSNSLEVNVERWLESLVVGELESKQRHECGPGRRGRFCCLKETFVVFVVPARPESPGNLGTHTEPKLTSRRALTGRQLNELLERAVKL